MRHLILFLLLLSTPAIAADDSPIVVMDASKPRLEAPAKASEKIEAAAPKPAEPSVAAAVTDVAKAVAADAITREFPVWAVTPNSADAAGQSPKAPAAPDVPKTAAALPTPGLPTDALWPSDTIPIFVRSCANGKPAFVPGCSCIITKLMSAMPHNEFITLSEAGTLDIDARLLSARSACVAQPTRKP